MLVTTLVQLSGRPSVMSSSSIYERCAKWGSVGLYPKFESLHADPFDWWEPRYHLGDGY